MEASIAALAEFVKSVGFPIVVCLILLEQIKTSMDKVSCALDRLAIGHITLSESIQAFKIQFLERIRLEIKDSVDKAVREALEEQKERTSTTRLEGIVQRTNQKKVPDDR